MDPTWGNLRTQREPKGTPKRHPRGPKMGTKNEAKTSSEKETKNIEKDHPETI